MLWEQYLVLSKEHKYFATWVRVLTVVLLLYKALLLMWAEFAVDKP